jgi:hypothetical protein
MPLAIHLDDANLDVLDVTDRDAEAWSMTATTASNLFEAATTEAALSLDECLREFTKSEVCCEAVVVVVVVVYVAWRQCGRCVLVLCFVLRL